MSTVYSGMQRQPLAYGDLPPGAFASARDGLLQLGYSAENILARYSYSTHDNLTIQINEMAFTDKVHRTPTDYAGVTIHNAVNGLEDAETAKILAESHAPFHLLHRKDSFSLWVTSYGENRVQARRLAGNIAYDQLSNTVQDFRRDLEPSRLAAIKQGREQFQHQLLRDIRPLQLSMWALEVTGPLLVQHFKHAIQFLTEGRIPPYDIDRIATHLLGATILADTNMLGDEARLAGETLSLPKLMSLARQRFHRYFTPELPLGNLAIHQAYRVLRRIKYAGFAPEMIADLYKAAYAAGNRRELGGYDTPLYLTRRVWNSIPVEFMPINQRSSVDMTCGWGSFLIAGHERFRRLTDMASENLNDYLHGNDIDGLTSRLAGLAMLTSTSEDSWQIANHDALRWPWIEQNRPGIIVGNPPFGANRKTIGTQPNIHIPRNRRYQAADAFLDRALDRLQPGGYLAMILPLSFTVAESSPELRRKLLGMCDIQELWELPTEIFPDAKVQTLMLLAKKHDRSIRSSFPVRVRSVQKGSLDSFKHGGPFTASQVVAKQSSWDEASSKAASSENTHLMDYQLILSQHEWSYLRAGTGTLSDWATIFLGAIVGKKPDNKRWQEYPSPKIVPWLTGGKETIPRSFFINYANATTIRYPNDLEEPRKNRQNPPLDREHLLAGTKVLLTSDPNPSWGKRVRVAIERRHHYASESFWVIVPKENAKVPALTTEVIAAVLDWHVANAWIVEHLKYPKIVRRALTSLPVPRELSVNDCNALTVAVRQIEEAAANNLPKPETAVRTIDTILASAYGLDQSTLLRLVRVTNWNQEQITTIDQQLFSENATYRVRGSTERIDAEHGRIVIAIQGFPESEEVPISALMPGWLLRPGAAFQATIPYYCKRNRSLRDVEWGTFVPQEYTYLDEDELLSELSALFHTTEPRA